MIPERVVKHHIFIMRILACNDDITRILPEFQAPQSLQWDHWSEWGLFHHLCPAHYIVEGVEHREGPSLHWNIMVRTEFGGAVVYVQVQPEILFWRILIFRKEQVIPFWKSVSMITSWDKAQKGHVWALQGSQYFSTISHPVHTCK